MRKGDCLIICGHIYPQLRTKSITEDAVGRVCGGNQLRITNDE